MTNVAGVNAESWGEVEQLIRQLAGEEHVARAITRERKSRGWSQERLAREVTRTGCPMPQSAISKIENPGRGAGGRRAVSIDEMLALSRAFEVTISDLLLPPNAREELEAVRSIDSGAAYLDQLKEQLHGYERLVREMAERVRTRPEWRERIENELREVKTFLDEKPREYLPKWKHRSLFLEEVLMTADDARRDVSVPHSRRYYKRAGETEYR